MSSSPGNVGMNPGQLNQDTEHDDHMSVYPRSSGVAPSKKSRKSLDLARARAKEDAEVARMAYEHKQRMELWRLEEEASLAELQWKIKTMMRVVWHLALLAPRMLPRS